MLSFPNPKINIGLFVTRKRPDGYHDLETIFAPVSVAAPTMQASMSLNDVLEVVPATETRITITGLAVAGTEADNLVWKAWHLLQASHPHIAPVHIYLHKKIPMGAGLGGGSADGAFMLRLLNDYYELGLSLAQLAELALLLGSDCPFFLYNKPCYASGRGEELLPISLDLSPFTIQIVDTAIHVSTANAFSLISPRPAPYDLRNLPDLPVESWKDVIHNDFEGAVFSRHPQLLEVRDHLYHSGALYASMTGSGSAIYGIFPKGKMANMDLDFFSKSYISEG